MSFAPRFEKGEVVYWKYKNPDFDSGKLAYVRAIVEDVVPDDPDNHHQFGTCYHLEIEESRENYLNMSIFGTNYVEETFLISEAEYLKLNLTGLCP